MRSDEKFNAFVELERQVLTITFYLASVMAVTNDASEAERCGLLTRIVTENVVVPAGGEAECVCATAKGDSHSRRLSLTELWIR